MCLALWVNYLVSASQGKLIKCLVRLTEHLPDADTQFREGRPHLEAELLIFEPLGSNLAPEKH